MHESVLAFVSRSLRDLPAGARVLDVGALNVNGSARDVIGEVDEYVGVDLVEGPGVDVVLNAHELTTELAGGFDVVLCLEMLEHDSAPWLTTAQLAAMAKPSGIVLVTARGNGFPLHNEPDCFRFLEAGFRAVLEAGGLEVLRIQPDPQVSGWFANCTMAEPAKPKPKPKRKAASGG